MDRPAEEAGIAGDTPEKRRKRAERPAFFVEYPHLSVLPSFQGDAQSQEEVGAALADGYPLGGDPGEHVVRAHEEVDPRGAEVQCDSERVELTVDKRIAHAGRKPVDWAEVGRQGQFREGGGGEELRGGEQAEPDLVVENGSLDETITMMTGGKRL